MPEKKPTKPKFTYDLARMQQASQVAQQVYEGLAYLAAAPLEELEYFLWASKEAGVEAKAKDPFGASVELDLNGHWENVHIMEAFIDYRRATDPDVEEIQKIMERRRLLEGVPGGRHHIIG